MSPTDLNDSAPLAPLARPNWTRRQRIAACAFVAYLALQVGVPVFKLLEPRPARFGWQMYSGIRQWPKFSAVLPDTTVSVDVSRYIVRIRADFYPADLSAHLCSRVPGAGAILEQIGKAEPREVPCS